MTCLTAVCHISCFLLVFGVLVPTLELRADGGWSVTSLDRTAPLSDTPSPNPSPPPLTPAQVAMATQRFRSNRHTPASPGVDDAQAFREYPKPTLWPESASPYLDRRDKGEWRSGGEERSTKGGARIGRRGDMAPVSLVITSSLGDRRWEKGLGGNRLMVSVFLCVFVCVGGVREIPLYFHFLICIGSYRDINFL